MNMEFKNQKLIKPVPFETNCINGNSKSFSAFQGDDSHSFEEGDDKDSSIKSDIPILLKLVEDVYNQRLLAIENNNNLDKNVKTEEKLLVLKSYVQHLQEQNDTFASTMIELEKEAQQRVKQMEKRLKSSAKTTMEAVINMHDCEREMRRLVEERLYIESLYRDAQQHLSSVKVENVFLRDQNFNLNHDVQALLHVIHHARSTGHWEMDCVTFCEVTPEQVFGPVQSISHIYSGESDSQSFDKYDDQKPSAYTDADNSPLEINSIYLSNPRHHSRVLPDKKSIFPVLTSIARLPKCDSLPEIGNIYSNTHIIRKSNSYETNTNNRTLDMKFLNRSGNHDTDELLKHNSRCDTLEQMSCIRKGQSEPHLFMFNDNLYKYRPCESNKRTSETDINENYQTSLPAYQSIDLKFPTEDSTLKVSAWNKLKNRSYIDAQENSFLKDNTSNSSCSSESEFRGMNKQMLRMFGEQITSLQTEKNVPMHSVGLQVETYKITQATQAVMTDTAPLQMDLFENNLVQMLKDNLTKAENKAEEKGILIEQLQNHLTSAVKEVELKDKALGNLEKKLQNSRDNCSNLKNQVGDLSSEIQLIVKDLEENRIINANLKKQMEQQSQIIRTLQEALVQSKRAFDAACPKMPLFQAATSENLQSKNCQPSKSSIVDI